MGCYFWHSHKPTGKSYSCLSGLAFIFSTVLEVYSVVLISFVLLVIKKGTRINVAPRSQIEQKIHLLVGKTWKGRQVCQEYLSYLTLGRYPNPWERKYKGSFLLLLFPNGISFNMLDWRWAHKRQLWWPMQPHRFQEGADKSSAVKLSMMRPKSWCCSHCGRQSSFRMMFWIINISSCNHKKNSPKEEDRW